MELRNNHWSKDKLFTGDIEARALDNLSVFLDPAVKNYNLGEAIFVAEEVPFSWTTRCFNV